MKPSLTSWRVASSVACGSGSSVSSSPTTSTLMKSEKPAAQVDALELGAATLEIETADGERDHVGLRGLEAAGEHLVRGEFPGAVDQPRPEWTATDDQRIVACAAAHEVDELQLIARADLGLVEIVGAPDLPVVLDDDPGRLHVELLEQVKEAHAIGDRAPLAVERDLDLAHRRDTSSRVKRASCRRRVASAG